MRQETAETLALKALAWIVANEELLPVFMGASGSSLAEIKTRAQEPEFLVSVLDFLLMDDAWIVGFCNAAQIAYDIPMQARQALPGGEQIHWT